MALSDTVRANAMGKSVCKALGIDYTFVHRIILDIPAEGPLMAYVEMYGSTKILEVDWSKLKGAQVTVLEKPE